jgi:hypothetical protein
MIGARFNGPIKQINYFPQNALLTNQPSGTWYAMEEEWANTLPKPATPTTPAVPGRTVKVDIRPHFPTNTAKKPNWFEVTYDYNKMPQTVPTTPQPIVNTLPVPTNVVGSPIFIIPNP